MLYCSKKTDGKQTILICSDKRCRRTCAYETNDQIILRQITRARIDELKDRISDNVQKLRKEDNILKLILNEIAPKKLVYPKIAEKIITPLAIVHKQEKQKVPEYCSRLRRRIRVPNFLQETADSSSSLSSSNTLNASDIKNKDMKYSSEIFNPRRNKRKGNPAQETASKKSKSRSKTPSKRNNVLEILPEEIDQISPLIIEQLYSKVQIRRVTKPGEKQSSKEASSEGLLVTITVLDEKIIKKQTQPNRPSSASSTVSASSSFVGCVKIDRNWSRSVVYLLKHIGSYRYAYTFLNPISEKVQGYHEAIKLYLIFSKSSPRDLKTLIKEVECG
ncbi:hypothetical protein HZS_3104, partial [Henneguya salminicola]